MADLTTNPRGTVQSNDDGVLNASLTPSGTSATISPIKKWVNGVLTTGGFDTTAGFVKIIDSTGRYEYASYGSRSVDASFVTTISSMRRGLSPTTSAYTAGTGQQWDANTRIYVVDYAEMWQDLVDTNNAQTISAKKTLSAGLLHTPFANTTARDVAFPSPTNGDECFVTGLGKQVYNGGWVTTNASTNSVATTTTAGTVEAGTTADYIAKTGAGGSGALVTVMASDVVTNATSAVSGSVVALNASSAVDVAIGGTGKVSHTVYAPIFGGTTTTGALQNGTVGTTGQVLTSNGAAALPTFQPAPAYSKVVYSSGTDSSAQATASATVFDTHSYTIPANDLVNGVCYSMEGVIVTSALNSGIKLCVFIAGSAVITGTAIGSNSAGNGTFRVLIMGTAAAGAAASVKSSSLFLYNSNSDAGYAAGNQATNGTLVIAMGCGFGVSGSAILKDLVITRHSTTPA